MATLETLTGTPCPPSSETESLLGCSKCGQSLPVSEFYPDTRYRHGVNPRCKSCKAADSKAHYHRYYEANKAKMREKAKNYPYTPEIGRRRRLRSHGVDQSWYDSMLLRYGGCMICRGTEPGKDGSFCIDHDHNCCPGSTGCPHCVRGILCHDCNTTLGKMNDDPARLRAAADYLEAHRGDSA